MKQDKEISLKSSSEKTGHETLLIKLTQRER